MLNRYKSRNGIRYLMGLIPTWRLKAWVLIKLVCFRNLPYDAHSHGKLEFVPEDSLELLIRYFALISE